MKIEPIVNHVLAERVLEIRERANNNEYLEIIGISDLWEKALAMDEAELITFTLAALHKYPDLVFATIAQDRAELLRKGSEDERSQDL